MSDNVNHPSHYASGKIECIKAIEVAVEGLEGVQSVCTANALKYLWRWKRKNGVEDLKKAVWYINYLIKNLEEEEPAPSEAPQKFSMFAHEKNYKTQPPTEGA